MHRVGAILDERIQERVQGIARKAMRADGLSQWAEHLRPWRRSRSFEARLESFAVLGQAGEADRLRMIPLVRQVVGCPGKPVDGEDGCTQVRRTQNRRNWKVLVMACRHRGIVARAGTPGMPIGGGHRG